MCGFVAVIGPGAALPEALLTHMRDQLAHRGPDGAANWAVSYAHGSVALGFRRLAIIDTRHIADQPMVSRDGQVVITLNGEIYNYIELREELTALGHQFTTRSDTEVLLHAYLQWGEAMMPKLNGMFAFAIWDARRGEAFIARDRFGEKPLYYTRLPDGKFAFASEMKALLAHPDVRADFDYQQMGKVLGGHILYGMEETLFSGIRQFPAAHTMRVGMDGAIIQQKRYWQPVYDRSLEGVSRESLIAQMREHLERSVRMRTRSDVPVTACLSGGLDSSSLVALLAGLPEKERIDAAISVRFPADPTIDEGAHIDTMLRATGITGHTVTPGSEDLVRDLRKLHWHQETIIAGPSMYLEWALMREARALGYKVILDGQGADELFAGYSTYLKAYQAELAHRGPLGILQARALGNKRDARLRNSARNYADSARRFSSKDSLSIRHYYSFIRSYAPGMLAQYGAEGIAPLNEIGALRYELAMNLLRTSLPSNLYSGDKNSMAHGIECRYPFLDYALADFATKLPDWAYLEEGWGKAILREAMEGILPESIAWRVDKVGFAAPQDTWMRTPAMKAWLEERIFDKELLQAPGYRQAEVEAAWKEHLAGTADHSIYLWKYASAAELMDMRRSGEWDGIPAPAPAAVGVKPKGIAWIISYTPVCKEPRVIRQAQVLIEAGWRVVVFGLPGTQPPPQSWGFIALPESISQASIEEFKRRYGKLVGRIVLGRYYRLKSVIRRLGKLAACLPVGRVLRTLGARLYASQQVDFAVKRKAIARYLESNPRDKPDLVLCHDYFTMDIASHVAQASGAVFSADCHEYSCGQYVHVPGWVKWQRPIVHALQDYYFKRADGVTTVCDGIAELIRHEHDVTCPVSVVRSMPFYELQPFRPTGENITVLYHGEIFASRGLHLAVRSLRLWRPEFQLLLRGNADAAYVKELHAIARECGVENRLIIEPAVPFNQIISAANKADIGYFVHEDVSLQRRFTLPNKFFEYVMAGLALCVSDLPEMAKIVKQFDMGLLVGQYDEQAIADAINRFDRPMIDAMKQRSIEAAKTLNWNNEKKRMLEFYEGILP